ncbi:C39 family peptidase [Polaromonas sp.]|uniref:C39 family peptidase n=1 Tax=Polaromonas sp. TaxID=1869339 RepID=UPI00272F1530|nr:C39 family peptidase [Polaromonas sp.]
MHCFKLPLAFTLVMATTVIPPASAEQAYLPSIAGGVVVPVSSIRQERLAGTLLQQYDFSCGSAAVATLLTQHYGYPVSEATVFEHMYKHGDQAKIQREGFSLLDMKRFLKAQGFEADGFEQPLEKLAEARVPAIVLINENGYLHFVVVKGLRGERVLIGDPANGTRAVSRQNFEASWQGGLLFVVHNRMESARFNLSADWRAAPQAPLTAGVNRNGLSSVTMPKHGPGDF